MHMMGDGAGILARETGRRHPYVIPYYKY